MNSKSQGLSSTPSPGRPAVKDSVRELEEIRRLLFNREQTKLRELQARVNDKEQRARDVSSILPQAIKLSRERGSELTNALLPAVESSVRDSIEQRPQVFVDALHPIIGSVVRRSIAESLRNLLQSFNQTLEHTFSWRGLRWRFEALRTGRSFAEVVMLRSLVYRVEQLFLIHRETSMSLLHVSADRAVTQDSDMVAGMLSAIQDFVRDSFKTGSDSALEEFRVGELQVWIARGRHAFLAAVIRGNPPRALRTMIEETIESVHILKASELENFKGDAAPFESLRPELESCLHAQYDRTKTHTQRKVWSWIVIAVALGFFVAVLIVKSRRDAQWNDFVAQLRAQPGITVNAAERGWFSKSHVSGLRDPLAPDPIAIARAAKLKPDGIVFDWKEYQALDPSLVVQRFRTAFKPPETVQAKEKNGVLTLTGSAPYEWITPVRDNVTKLAGITVLSDQLVIDYPPEPVLQRFTNRFGTPEGIEAKMGPKSTIILSGEATHAWLGRVRLGAKDLPGVSGIDDQKVTDLDLQSFKEAKAVIESAFIYFLVDKDNFATEGFTALSRMPEEVRRCLTAAKRLGYSVIIEIQGHADSIGSDQKNQDLSRRRAEAVRAFLVNCGFEPNTFRALGLGAPNASGQALPEQSERRVEFKVVLRPLADTP